MTKNEIISAINETIVPNGKKGINALALNNVLVEMANASGEGGSGNGALKLIIPDPELLTVFIDLGGITRENWSVLSADIAAMPDALDAYNIFVESMFTRNAELYAILQEKSVNLDGTFVLIDMSEGYKMFLEMMGITEGYTVNVAASMGILALATVFKQEIAEAGVSEEMTGITPINVAELGLPLPLMTLSETGEILFDSSSRSDLYIPENDSTTLTSDQIDANTGVKSAIYWDEIALSDVKVHLVRSSGTVEDGILPVKMSKGNSSSELVVHFFDGATLNVATFTSGSVTITSVGQLNT